MLSILIPTYNYSVFGLVKELSSQAQRLGITFEIRVLDDCSPNPSEENEQINAIANSYYQKLERNIGRSSIRNLLAKSAVYDTLLFLDADVEVLSEDFISNYLNALQPDTQIIYGGIVYQKEKPASDQILRWAYGNEREALRVEERQKDPHISFLTLNFIVRKNIFDLLSFNEEIPNLRHEDTLFALDAKKKEVSVAHIENPVRHLGLESSSVFLQKSIESVEALHLFIKEGLISAGETKLSGFAENLNRFGMSGIVFWLLKPFKKNMAKNLLSAKPSLLLFDLYRLTYYLELKSQKHV